jgi:hypothetical protein
MCCGQRVRLLCWLWSREEDSGMLARAGLSRRPRVPRALRPGGVLPAFLDADVGAAGVALLARLSESVRLRVLAAPAPRVSMAVAGSAGSRVDVLATLAVYEAGQEPLASEALAAILAASPPQSAEELLPAYAPMHAHAFGHAPPCPAPSSCGARVAVLFSGGLDSMLIARLAHEHAPSHEVIDLINVCFDAPGHASPDRLASLAGVLELRRACPGRQWQLICVNESLASATAASQHVAALLAPKHSHMDWNIGVALWFASRGVGWVELVRGADGVDSLGSPRGRPSRHLRYGDVAGAALPDGRHSLSAFDGPAAAAQRTTVLGGGVSSPHSGPAATVSAGDVALALSGGLREGLAGVVGSEPPQAHAALSEEEEARGGAGSCGLATRMHTVAEL